MPTREEYDKAKEVVKAYEDEQQRLLDIRLGNLKKDLDILFAKDGWIKEYDIEKSSFGHAYHISPEDPCLDECYDGEYDDEIEKLCKKHNVNAKFPYWCYPK